MSKRKIYNKLEFSGAMLKPGFSVYLFVITARKKKFYYVGMTGDGFYPSARSAIHRLSGHFELRNKSTQNQMKKVFFTENEGWGVSSVAMYHFPIKGFRPLSGKKKNINSGKLKGKKKEKNEIYKETRKKVHDFEEYLIYRLRKKMTERCLNKTKEPRKIKDYEIRTIEFKKIKSKLLSLVK